MSKEVGMLKNISEARDVLIDIERDIRRAISKKPISLELTYEELLSIQNQIEALACHRRLRLGNRDEGRMENLAGLKIDLGNICS